MNPDLAAHHLLWDANGRAGKLNDFSVGSGSWGSAPSADSALASSAAASAASAKAGRTGDDSDGTAKFHVLHTSAGMRSSGGPAFNACLRAAMVGATVIVDDSSGRRSMRSMEDTLGSGDRSCSSSFDLPPPPSPPRGRLIENEREQEQPQQDLPQPRRFMGQATSEDDVEERGVDGSGEERMVKEVLAVIGGREDVIVIALMESDGPEIPGLARFCSKGLSWHATGRCKPCHYVHTPNGCQNGLKCAYCHLPHMHNNPRPCKMKRQHYRQFQAMLESMLRDSPQRFSAALLVAAESCPELRTLAETTPNMRRGEGLLLPLAPGLVAVDPLGGKRRNILSL